MYNTTYRITQNFAAHIGYHTVPHSAADHSPAAHTLEVTILFTPHFTHTPLINYSGRQSNFPRPHGYHTAVLSADNSPSAQHTGHCPQPPKSLMRLVQAAHIHSKFIIFFTCFTYQRLVERLQALVDNIKPSVTYYFAYSTVLATSGDKSAQPDSSSHSYTLSASRITRLPYYSELSQHTLSVTKARGTAKHLLRSYLHSTVLPIDRPSTVTS